MHDAQENLAAVEGYWERVCLWHDALETMEEFRSTGPCDRPNYNATPSESLKPTRALRQEFSMDAFAALLRLRLKMNRLGLGLWVVVRKGPAIVTESHRLNVCLNYPIL